MTTENILDTYNEQVSNKEICYKNNNGNEHDWESNNRSYITKDIVEIECFCSYYAETKYVYDYYILEDSEI